MRKLLLPVLAVAVLLVACGGGAAQTTSTTAPPAKLRVVATTTVLADFARVIGSDYLDIYTVVNAETDPHGYSPSPEDIRALAEAQIVLKNGAGLDDWVDAALRTSGGRAKLVDAGVDVQKLPGDPHIWHSPQNAKLMVDTVRRGLAEVDRARESQYAISGRSYSSQIDGLERDIQQSMEAVKSTKLVTHHKAFAYYAAEFKLNYVGSVVPSVDADGTVTPEQTTALVEAIKQQGVRAVFAEQLLPSSTAQAVATAAGVKLVAGDEALYADGLGSAGTSGATYLQAIRHNSNVLVRHLS